jgi:hypothetical protein
MEQAVQEELTLFREQLNNLGLFQEQLMSFLTAFVERTLIASGIIPGN